MPTQLRGWEWLIIVGLVLLLFGAKRMPETARGLGRSLRIFKAETRGLADDDSAKGVQNADTVIPEADRPAVPPAASL